MENKIRIMLVDDHAVVRSGLGAFLSVNPDLELIGEAENGEQAVVRAGILKPDVILMDINLPGISGIEAMKILHADPTTAHIPIIALSANAVPRDIETAPDAGFFRYLTKPIKVAEFMDTLDVALKFSQTQAAFAAKKEPA